MERRAFLEDRGIVVTQDVLREAVRRDIETLFNTERLEARHLLSDSERVRAEDPADLMADFPHVRRSVLNYGVPSFSGRRARDFDPEQLARELKEVVAVFEPRLKRDTIRIKVDTRDKAGMKIEIEGLLMLAPVPERLKLATMIDLDSGRAATNIEDG
jgi:type VI secretion system protein ImpF